MTEQKPAYPGRVKYNERLARNYQTRKPHKHRAEMRLIDRAFTLIPSTHRVLDVPCGGGRVMIHLAQRGYDASGADLSEAMRTHASDNAANAGVTCTVEHQDLEALTCREGEYDTIVCFRLFHHFPTPEIRQRVISELCRIAGKNVVLSYFSPLSIQSFRRKISGKDQDRFATPLSEVESYFAKAGFRLVKDFAQMPVFHTLHLAVFERVATK